MSTKIVLTDPVLVEQLRTATEVVQLRDPDGVLLLEVFPPAFRALIGAKRPPAGGESGPVEADRPGPERE